MKKLVLLSLISLAACNPASDPKKVGTSNCTQVDYRNGVYYFPCNEADFANGLSSFIEHHSDLEVIAATGDGTGGYGRDEGYFVVTRSKDTQVNNTKK